MKKHLFFITIAVSLLLSCSKTKQGDLLEIPIDIYQSDGLMPLSEITEELIAIELELTNESTLDPTRINRVIISEDKVFITTWTRIFVFDKDGKYIRSIGSQGQGPGEYTNIRSIALDEKNKRLFVASAAYKIIAYDFDGKFLKETFFRKGSMRDINYVNEKLLLLAEKVTGGGSDGMHSLSAVYQLNDDLQLVDSCTIRDFYPKNINVILGGPHPLGVNHILKGSKSIDLYYGDYFLRNDNMTERVLRDTLYRFENNHLIPDLKLKFRNNDANKIVHIYNIYRSSRYIFATYTDYNRGGPYYNLAYFYFCYDTKTGKGYNMKDGYTDDINKIEKPVKIRPSLLDTEMFYYWHTNMKPGDKEEPNPTLLTSTLLKS